jgi:hypothetical protein
MRRARAGIPQPKPYAAVNSSPRSGRSQLCWRRRRIEPSAGIEVSRLRRNGLQARRRPQLICLGSVAGRQSAQVGAGADSPQPRRRVGVCPPCRSLRDTRAFPVSAKGLCEVHRPAAKQPFVSDGSWLTANSTRECRRLLQRRLPTVMGRPQPWRSLNAAEGGGCLVGFLSHRPPPRHAGGGGQGPRRGHSQAHPLQRPRAAANRL